MKKRLPLIASDCGIDGGDGHVVLNVSVVSGRADSDDLSSYARAGNPSEWGPDSSINSTARTVTVD